ncbi:hypothetical protein K9B35_14290 [Sphingomonas sp. R647]|uniref:hypothetical protein n=1 Tax=Sphingomonas sp. R647 TaxID=2875233 RepID=UPI001CD7570B|nr:hypothetical protein [Sphingomonas sp. R647]MCA1199143.1 hypothetical protein [Sphingomonas sp. R647]
MSDFRRRVRAAFTRLANTTQYAAGDLVANHATAGSVVPLEISPGARFPGGAGTITAVSIDKSSVTLTDAEFKVHLFDQAPGVTNGDNGPFAITNGRAKGYIGSVAVVVGQALGDGSQGRASCDIIFDTTKPNSKLYALIEATDTYTPASAEEFGVTLELTRD